MNSPEIAPPNGEILIIDDIPDNLRFLSDLLSQAGYAVRKVTTGESGLEAAQLQPPDLILLDIRMPGISGYEVCDRLKLNPPTSQIPVIFLSAMDEELDKVMAFQAGGVDYITKPFQVVEVLARIETHLKLSRLQQQLQRQNDLLQQHQVTRSRADSTASSAATSTLQVTQFADPPQQTEAKPRLLVFVIQAFRQPIVRLLAAVEGRPQTKVDRFSQAIEPVVQHLNHILQDALLLMDLAEHSLTLTPIALTAFCQSLVQQWQPLPDAHYQLSFVTWGRPPQQILLDRVLLQQILTQLLTNAVADSPPDGSILFELVYEPEQAVIRIRNEGNGLSVSDRVWLFDRQGEPEGSDLGRRLAVVQQAVKRHNGTMAVNIEPDQGTTVTIRLPLQWVNR